MEPCYMWLEFGHINQTSGLFSWFLNDSKMKRVIDIMGAPIQSKEFKSHISSMLLKNNPLCGGTIVNLEKEILVPILEKKNCN